MKDDPSGFDISAASVSSVWSRLLRLLEVVRTHRELRALVGVLLAIDVFWLVYYCIARTLHELDGDRTLYNLKTMLITTDRGLPEWFGYAMTLGLIALLVVLRRKTRQPIYAALAAIYVIVLLDDALQVHEYFGRRFVGWLDIPRGLIGLRPEDIGEVLTWSILGAAVLPMLWFSLKRSGPRHRVNGLAILVAFAALVFCAVGVDQLYSNFHDVHPLSGMLIDLVEDGGELLAITLAFALALGALRELRPSTVRSGLVSGGEP